jgi:Glycosyltransferase sugar-binding region containing DXD motif
MSDMQTDLDVTNKTIRGVWFASELTAIQQLCIKSYMDQGHEFHLYVAGPTKGVPEGTIVEDANAYLSASERKKFPHNSQAADLCRILVVLKEGGWYVDLDTVCLRPFDFPEPYVFVSEDPSKYGKQKSTKIPLTPCLETVTNTISNNIFKAPAGSPFLQYIADRIRSSDTLHPGHWTVFGPILFMEAIPKFHLEQYVKAPIVLDAANPNELYHLVDGNVRYNISEKSYAMHFRTSWWSGLFQPSLSAVHHPDSLFEQLKRKHNVATSGPCYKSLPYYYLQLAGMLRRKKGKVARRLGWA